MKTKTMIVAVVALALLAGMAVFAVASTVATYSGATTASGVVNARATANPRIELTITTPDITQQVLFGAVDPGASITHSTPVSLLVKSNKGYNLTRAIAGDVALMGFSTTLVNQMGQLKTNNAGATFSDTYSINVPWDTDPGNYTSTVTYTVTQP